MKSGRYAMQFRADDLLDSGVLSIVGPEADGHGKRFSVRGNVMCAGPHLIASMTVAVAQRTDGDPSSDDTYTVSMRGVASDGHFSLRGVGPLGIVVEIIAIAVTSAETVQSHG
jgi:hypothetical protein